MRALVIGRNFFHKIVLQRYLIWNFSARDLKSRYVGSMMGLFWSVIHPLVLLAAYSFVFSVVFQVRDFSRDTDNFPLFVFCGILPWLFFQETVLRCCYSVTEQRHLLRKMVFPSEILPISVTLSNLVTHVLGVLVLLVVLGYLGLLSWTALLLPVYMILLAIFALGLGWLMAALQVFLKDAAQLLSVALVFWFWLTPIFYSLERVPARFRPLLLVNPLTYVVEGYRSLLMFQAIPSATHLGALCLLTLVSFLIGGWVFRATKRDFVDVL